MLFFWEFLKKKSASISPRTTADIADICILPEFTQKFRLWFLPEITLRVLSIEFYGSP